MTAAVDSSSSKEVRHKPLLAPVSTVLDETYKIALTRFDHRIRVGGMAELAGFDRTLRPQLRATLEMVTRQLFPGGDLGRADFWTGLRPMTPAILSVVTHGGFAGLGSERRAQRQRAVPEVLEPVALETPWRQRPGSLQSSAWIGAFSSSRTPPHVAAGGLTYTQMTTALASKSALH